MPILTIMRHAKSVDRMEAEDDFERGLTERGRALIRACNRLRIMVDLSHLNERGFWDVARIHWPSRTIYRVDERIENFDSDDAVVPGVTDEMIRNGHCTTLD